MGDTLTDILASVRLSSALFCTADCAGPWAVHTDGLPGGLFHAVVRGSPTFRLDGRHAPLALAPGDVVLLPHGDAHTMSDSPLRPAVPIRDLVGTGPPGQVASLRIAGRGEATRLLCGRFDFERFAPHPLLRLLPRVVHLRAGEQGLSRWLPAVVALLEDEVTGGRPGAGAVEARLTDVLVVQALRACIARESSLAALRDAQVGEALRLLHARPGEAWTAERLARQVGLSRSRLFSRFSQLVGEPPSLYLARWRIHLAARHLRERPDLPVAAIAEVVGYASEAALSKAFKRTLGLGPRAYRQGQAAA